MATLQLLQGYGSTLTDEAEIKEFLGRHGIQFERWNIPASIQALCANPTLDEPAGGEPEDEVSEPISPEVYAQIAQGWVAAGATVIGGCCGTNPDFIAALQRTI